MELKNVKINKVKGCPFCEENVLEIAFAENKNFLAIYNVSPILPGHSLIIPKKHITSLFELDNSELTEFMSIAQQVGKLLSEPFHTKSFNWSIQEMPPAGQTVSHLHMHVIPRHEGDLPEPGDWYPQLEAKYYSGHIDNSKRISLS